MPMSDSLDLLSILVGLATGIIVAIIGVLAKSWLENRTRLLNRPILIIEQDFVPDGNLNKFFSVTITNKGKTTAKSLEARAMFEGLTGGEFVIGPLIEWPEPDHATQKMKKFYWPLTDTIPKLHPGESKKLEIFFWNSNTRKLTTGNNLPMSLKNLPMEGLIRVQAEDTKPIERGFKLFLENGIPGFTLK